MTYFDQPNITNGFVDILTWSNSVTGNYFSILILVALFLVMFIAMKTRGIQTEKALASCAFSTTLVSYIMLIIPNLISPDIIAVMTMITAVSVVFLYKAEGQRVY